MPALFDWRERRRLRERVLSNGLARRLGRLRPLSGQPRGVAPTKRGLVKPSNVLLKDCTPIERGVIRGFACATSITRSSTSSGRWWASLAPCLTLRPTRPSRECTGHSYGSGRSTRLANRRLRGRRRRHCGRAGWRGRHRDSKRQGLQVEPCSRKHTSRLPCGAGSPRSRVSSRARMQESPV